MRHGSMMYGNTTQEHANDPIYTTMPNEDVTTSNDVPGTTPLPQWVCGSISGEFLPPVSTAMQKEQRKLVFLCGV
jgi:hypothetical protein